MSLFFICAPGGKNGSNIRSGIAITVKQTFGRDMACELHLPAVAHFLSVLEDICGPISIKGA